MEDRITRGHRGKGNRRICTHCRKPVNWESYQKGFRRVHKECNMKIREKNKERARIAYCGGGE